MAWEYKVVEATDFGHPGGQPRFQEFVNELGRLSADGWEVDQLVPTMQRGRSEAPAGAGGKETSSVTAVAMIALLKRKVG